MRHGDIALCTVLRVRLGSQQDHTMLEAIVLELMLVTSISQ
jgi:hypothetical protein